MELSFDFDSDSSGDTLSVLSLESFFASDTSSVTSIDTETSSSSSDSSVSASGTSSNSSSSSESNTSFSSSSDDESLASVVLGSEDLGDLDDEAREELLQYIRVEDEESAEAGRPYKFHMRRILEKATEMNPRVFNVIFRCRPETFEKLYREVCILLPPG